jgi:hypothetical protein
MYEASHSYLFSFANEANEVYMASGFEAKKRDDRFMEYIWQRENWPFFKWGIAQLFPLLSRCRLEQGKLRAWAEAGHGGERVGGEFPRRRNSWVGGH